jgi:hypothetical protein
MFAALMTVCLGAVPAFAQEPAADDELVVCYFGGDLMVGAVQKDSDANATSESDATLPELPTIEDDGK